MLEAPWRCSIFSRGLCLRLCHCHSSSHTRHSYFVRQIHVTVVCVRSGACATRWSSVYTACVYAYDVSEYEERFMHLCVHFDSHRLCGNFIRRHRTWILFTRITRTHTPSGWWNAHHRAPPNSKCIFSSTMCVCVCVYQTSNGEILNRIQTNTTPWRRRLTTIKIKIHFGVSNRIHRISVDTMHDAQTQTTNVRVFSSHFYDPTRCRVCSNRAADVAAMAVVQLLLVEHRMRCTQAFFGHQFLVYLIRSVCVLSPHFSGSKFWKFCDWIYSIQTTEENAYPIQSWNMGIGDKIIEFGRVWQYWQSRDTSVTCKREKNNNIFSFRNFARHSNVIMRRIASFQPNMTVAVTPNTETEKRNN